jgi:hypothetical protein
MEEQIEWLMQGDPVIRWQVMRDLLDRPTSEWKEERQKTVRDGWVKTFLDHQLPDGTWPVGRWTGQPWVFLTLIDCGIPEDHKGLQSSVRAFLDRQFDRLAGKSLVANMDLCHIGFWLRAGSYFTPADPRLQDLVETILNLQFADGGWNCRKRMVPKTCHGSFHTTFNVLEGLRVASERGLISSIAFRDTESRALEFMLVHHMYKSDKTGEVVDKRFLNLTYPSHWHYNVLRALDYMRSTQEIVDPRLDDPIQAMKDRMNAKGRWPNEKKISGIELFGMESWDKESRWNTLRMLRILKERAIYDSRSPEISHSQVSKIGKAASNRSRQIG